MIRRRPQLSAEDRAILEAEDGTGSGDEKQDAHLSACRLALPLLLGLFVCTASTVAVAHRWLPSVKGATRTPSTEFSEERARVHLDAIVGCGVRTVGSYGNEVAATNYIQSTVEKLRQTARDAAVAAGLGARREVDVEVLVQRPSGAFSTDFLGGFTNTCECCLKERWRRASCVSVGGDAYCIRTLSALSLTLSRV